MLVCVSVCVCVCVGGYLLYPYKHHQSHQEQAACAINTHIVWHWAFAFWKDRWVWNDVDLAVGRRHQKHSERVVNVQLKWLPTGRTSNIPAESLWCPVCTWIQRRWFPGRSRGPPLLQTRAPEIWISCSTSRRLWGKEITVSISAGTCTLWGLNIKQKPMYFFSSCSQAVPEWKGD